MPVQFAPEWSPKTALLLAYLTTISLNRALRIMGMYNNGVMTFDVFASLIIDGVPTNFFLVPLPIPDGAHFVIHEGNFQIAPHGIPEQEQIMPEDVLPYLEQLNPSRLQTVPPPIRSRPLNSFMVCRTFLAPLFPYIGQKTKSQLISLLWANDPYKAQWAVLAQAYSRLRDHFDLSDSRLAKFIESTKELFNFPTPGEYLDHVGWRISQTNWDNFSLLRSIPRDTFQLPSQAVTERDIIDHCRTITGYTTRKRGSLWPLRNGFITTMAINQFRHVPRLWLPDFPQEHGNDDEDENEFTLADFYDDVEPNMDPITDLIHVPVGEEESQEEAFFDAQQDIATLLTEINRTPDMDTLWGPWYYHPASNYPRPSLADNSSNANEA